MHMKGLMIKTKPTYFDCSVVYFSNWRRLSLISLKLCLFRILPCVIIAFWKKYVWQIGKNWYHRIYGILNRFDISRGFKNITSNNTVRKKKVSTDFISGAKSQIWNIVMQVFLKLCDVYCTVKLSSNTSLSISLVAIAKILRDFW